MCSYTSTWSYVYISSNKLPNYLCCLHQLYLLSPSVGSQAVHAPSPQQMNPFSSLQSRPDIHKTSLDGDTPSINNVQPLSETVAPNPPDDDNEGARQLRELENSRM